ncbi:hypothetical protein VU01_11829 [Candidatus Electrothrix marina]|uniref:Uncharacterized protein n=1 Tax=Candidatus Electrothrix marina TaxID=1859130 RepID=A0A444JDQ2_9BACT|nr:hypothetical protein VU01_11829 [Candidatus Electrothrix marina]
MPNIAGKILIRGAREEDLTGLVFLLEVLFSIEKDFTSMRTSSSEGYDCLYRGLTLRFWWRNDRVGS